MRTLYIGAHPDDVCIGCAVSIKQNPRGSFVLTVSDGVPKDMVYPIRYGGILFNDSNSYRDTRLSEDKKAMEILGLDCNSQYMNGRVPDLEGYLHFNDVYGLINGLVETRGIEEIVAHAVPDAHPDHEIVSLCSHLVAQKKGIEVWEFPLYVVDSDGALIDRQFLDSSVYDEVNVLDYDSSEMEMRDRAINQYQTQAFIRERFRGGFEMFGKRKLDFSTLPFNVSYFYGEEVNLPRPSDIKEAFMRFSKSKLSGQLK
jgi:LmbE family N-acetylglucosaminyl deacetylase